MSAKANQAKQAQSETAKRITFRHARGVTPLKAIKAVGSYFAFRFGRTSEEDPSKVVLSSKEANEALGVFLCESARKLANGEDAESVTASLFAIGSAFQGKGQPLPAMVKAAGQVLRNVTSEEQAAERRDLESFEVEELSALVERMEIEIEPVK